ncbi:FAD dependent oxidoreductase-domain-containing protein [Sordaria brevicollis]|uniref:FAD dependent oxidoreductase-domain-containing protein n=1 Tax=Sordaria brevicollis TaxID=83679 RepID=A0AAE0PLN6_SORBR|nr:FAD dependent oxidoreductase-domain-containing protein [Sordaria brevicollis]
MATPAAPSSSLPPTLSSTEQQQQQQPPLATTQQQQPSSSSSSSSSPLSPPSSILIIGSGVFGLTTAYALSRRHDFANTTITVVDRADPSNPDVFPAPDAASVDTSRIIRADYPDAAYAALAAEAQLQWRQQTHPDDLGSEGRYSESGLLVVADGPAPPPGTPVVTENTVIDKTKLTGMDYARFSWANVLSIASSDPELVARIKECPNPEAIKAALGTGGSSGSWGYINGLSGWANAGASMAWLYKRVKAEGRIKFVAGEVTNLEVSGGNTVTGARLADGRVLSADLVMVSTGAWTGRLVDLTGQAVATGQVLGYIDLTPEEEAQLAHMPVILNLSTGLFVIPPKNGVLKIARHAYGYLNPTTLPIPPLASSVTTPAAAVSLPLTTLSDPTLQIPTEGADDLRRALHEMVPLPSLRDRPFSKTRICWYSDTPTADFIIDYHPEYKGLFVATGDSGHAFKFMPVIGEKIADVIAGQCPPEFVGKWNWRYPAGDAAIKAVITEDGSRGGVPGLILSTELRASVGVAN